MKPSLRSTLPYDESARTVRAASTYAKRRARKTVAKRKWKTTVLEPATASGAARLSKRAVARRYGA